MFSSLVWIALWAAGVVWCCEIIGRWREDLKELREVDEPGRKAGIIIVWAITIVIAVAVIWAAIIVLARIISGLPGLKIFF
jgi:hypothetical protein